MNECKIIEDLLPLYTDGLLQEDTNEFVKLHLVRCAQCSELERRLKAKVEVPPPAPDRKKFRRAGRKLRLKAVLISGTCVLLALGIFLAAYLPVQRRRIAALDEQRQTAIFLGGIAADAKRQAEKRMPDLEIERGSEWENRAVFGDYVLHLPDEFQRVESEFYEGYYVHYRTFPFADYNEVTDVIRVSEIGNEWPEYRAPQDSESKESYEKGYRLLYAEGVRRRMELAEYYFGYDFSSLSEESSEDDLAIAAYLTKAWSDIINNASFRRITGWVNGYCIESGTGWRIYLKTPQADRLLEIELEDYDRFGPVRNPLEWNDETLEKLLSGVEFL